METILIRWTNDYSVNHTLIDEQHQTLIEIINRLYAAFKVGEADNIIRKLIDELFAYTEYHFIAEEELLKKQNYQQLDEHKIEHQRFIDQILEFKDKAQKGDFVVSYEVMNFLRNWLVTHIMTSDKQYVRSLTNN